MLRIDFPRGVHGRAGPAIAVSGNHQLHPRPTERLDPTAAVYRSAADELLTKLKISHDAPTIAQAVRSDLDGDGVDEVLIVAERISDPRTLFAEPGDYSVAFVRHIRDGRVETTVLMKSTAPAAGEDVTPYVESYRFAAISDLNGDGRMEIALSMDYYEGGGTTVHEMRRDGTLRQVLSSGCGA